MRVYTIEDITGDGGAHQVSASSGEAKWVQFVAGGTGTVRVGDSNVSATRGLPVPSGGGMFLPMDGSEVASRYSLNQVYYFAPLGATLSITYVT